MEERLERWKPRLQDDGSWLSGEVILDDVQSELEMALMIGRWYTDPEQREWAFWKFAELVWSADGLGLVGEDIFIWNPWGADIIKELCAERYVAIGGASNGTKSFTCGGWGIFNWMVDPENVLVLCTSTTIGESKKRIWGAIDTLLTPLIQAGIAPTRITSRGNAFYHRPNKSIKEKAGLQVVAGAIGSDRESTRKLVGTKSGPETRILSDGRVIVRPRLILIADELAELSPAIVAADANLRSQKYQMVSMSNPKSKFDAFAETAEPVNGFDSVDLLNDHRWRTKMGGVYIRLDAEQSPNVLAGETIYPFLPSIEEVNAGREKYGDNSAEFLRFFRAVFFSAAESEGLYTKAELKQAEAFEKGAKFRPGTERWLASLDPSQGNEGDKCPLSYAVFGYLTDGRPAIEFGEVEYLFSDATNKLIPHPYQIARQVIARLKEKEIPIDRLAVDSTLGDVANIIINETQNPAVHCVNSNGAATTRPLQIDMAKAGQTNKDYFTDRAAELWLAMKPLLMRKQIFGLRDRVAEQMTTRGMNTGSRLGGAGKMGVEPKKEYRSRTGESPDDADGANLLIDLAIERFGLLPTAARDEKETSSVPIAPPMEWWDLVGRDPNSMIATSVGGWGE